MNANFDAIAAALENTVSRDGTSPNSMSADLDMNSHQVINLSTPTLDSQAATKLYVDNSVGTGTGSLAYALSRANHTGTQAISTVVNLQSSLDAKPNLTGANAVTGTWTFSVPLEIGNASDTTLARQAAGILSVEGRQLGTVGPKVFRSSQYLTNAGSVDDSAALASLVTTVNAAGGVFIVDGLIKLSSDTTLSCPTIVEGGGFTVDSAKVLSITSPLFAGRYKIFQGAGTVTWVGHTDSVYPEWWGVVSGGSSAVNRTSVNACNASIGAGAALGYGAVVQWGNGIYGFSGTWTTITSNNIVHRGTGQATLGTWFYFDNTTGDDISFSNCQYSGIERINITNFSKKTSGSALKMTSVYRGIIEKFTVYYGYNAIELVSCTETRIVDPEFRQLLGTRGIQIEGAAGAGSYRTVINNIIANNPYPQSGGSVTTPARVKGNWAISTAYVVDDVVVANSRIWQCTTAGTSAGTGSGPSATPGTTATDVWTTTTADGTAAWKFVMQSELTWVNQDNYAYSVTMKQGALINGAYSIRMMDTAATGTSYPIWCYVDNVDTDHPYWAGIYADRGEGLYVTQSWHGSTLGGHGINLRSNFRGDVAISNSRIYGNLQHGIFVNCPNVIINGNQIGDNSAAVANTYDGIIVAANINNFSITGNMVGDSVSVAGNNQKYGIEVTAGTSDNYIISGNWCMGNTTGKVQDGGTGVNKSVTGNV